MKISVILIVVYALICGGAPHAFGDAQSASDPDLVAQVAQADRLLVQKDKPNSKDIATPATAFGSYPRRKGVILVTPDLYKNLIPTGHAGIVLNSGQLVESIDIGVVRGTNNWNLSKSQAYGVTVSGTSASQDSIAADWANRQLGKPYNYNYLNRNTRKAFYCSQLVWAAFKDNFDIDLDTLAWGPAIHPMELVTSSSTRLIWRKK